MAYDGVMISDDLQMAAIADHFSRAEAVERAIRAGVDIIAFTNSTIFEERIVPQTVDLIEGLARDRQIGENRIAQSYERIGRIRRGCSPQGPDRPGSTVR
ncbi:MAG: hypothetical protein GEU73_01300 [Chloroflexi bacterium]|nr:hypothetical protein [Chloroflexota bacterium]